MNYLEAIHHGQARLKTLPISTRLFHELYEIILKESRGQNRSPGEYRKIQNFIGPTGDIKDASYIPPEPQRISEYIDNLEQYINGNYEDQLDILIRAGIIHAQFETIHPYLDGNGRLGRILIILYLLDNNIISKPSFFLSEELEKNKFKYYGLLNHLRNDNPQWYNWLEFFLNSATKQADRYVDKLLKIEELHAAMISLAEQNEIRVDLINFIFTKSYFTISNVQEHLGISYNTASKHVNKLVQTGRVFADDKRRNKIYRFYDIVDILNG
jgi:Fic family protein